MKPTVKRISTGFYQYTFPNGLVFDVYSVAELNGWIFKNANNDYEGGDDVFYSKKEALSALVEYVTVQRNK